jgi:hypothetical protein
LIEDDLLVAVALVGASVGEILREGGAESVGLGVGLLETEGATLMEGDDVLDLDDDLFDEAFVEVDESDAADTVYTAVKVLEDADLLLIVEMDDALEEDILVKAVGLALMEGELVGC